MSKKTKEDVLLYTGVPSSNFVDNFKKIGKKHPNRLKLAIIYDKNTNLEPRHTKRLEKVDYISAVDFNSQKSIILGLKPILENIVAVTTNGEKNISYLQKIIPNVPYVKTPTVKSLIWSTEKIEMRKQLKYHSPDITPHFMVAHNNTKESIEKIIKDVGFPLVIKPTGLAESILVNVVYHKEELENVLEKVFKKIDKVWEETKGRGKPNVLVEHYMEGKMYSFDAFVNHSGIIRICPPVSVKTGKEIGFDDFFGYRQMVPSGLNKENIKEGKKVVKKSIYALGLRSTSVHVELMKTEQGWKVIELGPRLGGFRRVLYGLSYGIDLQSNDIQTRISDGKVRIPKKIKGYTSTFKFFAREEGYITTLTGIKKIQELKSFHSIEINKKVGDKAFFAKNGGKSVFNITLFNRNKSDLLADIRRMEKTVKIETTKSIPETK